MSALGDLLRSRSAVLPPITVLPPSTRPAATYSFWQSRPAVGNSEDLERILALPRQPEAPEDLVQRMTAKYARPGGTMKLRDIQAKALWQTEIVGGLVAPVGVGFG